MNLGEITHLREFWNPKITFKPDKITVRAYITRHDRNNLWMPYYRKITMLDSERFEHEKSERKIFISGVDGIAMVTNPTEILNVYNYFIVNNFDNSWGCIGHLTNKEKKLLKKMLVKAIFFGNWRVDFWDEMEGYIFSHKTFKKYS